VAAVVGAVEFLVIVIVTMKVKVKVKVTSRGLKSSLMKRFWIQHPMYDDVRLSGFDYVNWNFLRQVVAVQDGLARALASTRYRKATLNRQLIVAITVSSQLQTQLQT
jgi:hypothetical protein